LLERDLHLGGEVLVDQRRESLGGGGLALDDVALAQSLE